MLLCILHKKEQINNSPDYDSEDEMSEESSVDRIMTKWYISKIYLNMTDACFGNKVYLQMMKTGEKLWKRPIL